jgi:hypothetical protein
MKKRGQKVRLKNSKTEDFVTVKVILADSRQGYLASDAQQNWAWYNLNEWSEVK